MKKIPVVLLLTMLLTLSLFAEKNYNRVTGPTLQKPTETSDIWLDINRLSGIFRNNGIWHFDVVANTQGTEWPKGSHNSPIFAGGQWIAASVNGEIKVAGIQHSATEYQAGMILSPGVADNPKDPKYKWYELRSSGTDDRTRWPVDQGAPVDGSGDPLLLGDQTIFSVWNDLGDHAEYGTNKLSVEVQQTAWAYNRADALGDMHFIKWRMVNKSGEAWDSTYFSIWLDPDLGDAGDDLVGCDSTLGLGFTYNANNADQTYGTPPPAQGIDFFQGPIIDEVGSTVTLPNGTVLQDKTMRKMTSFVYYDNNDSNSGNPTDGGDVWGYMRGFWRDGTAITFGDRGATPGNPPTKFMFPGDPETEQTTGWLDYAEDDRRFLMTTGPFPMPAWVDENGNGIPDFGEPGVQDVVAGVILAKGADNLNSVTKLKEVDGLAQLAYDLDFNLSKAPLPPLVQANELENQIVVTWDKTSEYLTDGFTPYSSEDPIVTAALGDTVIIDNVVQVIDDDDYNFYGYSVYQYSDASGADPVLLEHWDNGGTSGAEPYTSQRYAKMLVNKNSVVGNSGTPLINGKEYYFGVVAEAYLAFGAPKIFTSPPTIVTVTPQATPGMGTYSSVVGDTLISQHLRFDTTQGFSGGNLIAIVVDPSKTTGHDYRVVFKLDTLGNQFWDLEDVTTGEVVLADQINQSGSDAYTVVDGLLVKVIGAALDFTSFQCVANAAGPIDPVESAAAPWQNFPCPTGVDPDGYVTDGQQVGTGHWMFHTGDTAPTGTRGSYDVFKERSMRSDNFDWAVPYDFEMRFTAEGSWAVRAFEDGLVLKVPFELWCVGLGTHDDPSDDFRMVPWFLSSAGVGGLQTDTTGMTWQLDPNDHAGSGGPNDPYTPWVYWIIPDEHVDYSAGQAGYQAFVAAIDTVAGNEGSYGYGGEETIARSVFINWNGDDVSDGSVDPTTQMAPEQGSIFRLITTKPNSTNDYYAFSAPAAVEVTSANLTADMKKIKVVPNPYYGYHSGELDPFNRWVQFTYLPPTCTVRIFDLAGNLIRKLEKNDASTPFLQWDMKNEYELPVASGIYVFHVDAEGLGEKIGKIAIFTPNERLDTW